MPISETDKENPSSQEKTNRKARIKDSGANWGILPQLNAKHARAKQKKSDLRLGELLIEAGMIKAEQLESALEKQKKSRRRLGDILVSSSTLSEVDLAKMLSFQLNIPYIVPKPYIIDKQLVININKAYFMKHKIIPAFKEDNLITVIMADPLDTDVIKDLGSLYKMKVEPAIATPSQITNVLTHLFSQVVFGQAKKEARSDDDKALVIRWKAGAIIEKDRFVDMINFIIMDAVDHRASDLHIEPLPNLVRIRFRIDGILVHYSDLPKSWGNRVAARIKVICGLDISEKRRHQDGRIQANIQDKEIDLRVSTYVSVYGENIVIRILNRTTTFFELDGLGMTPNVQDQFRKKLSLPAGVTIVTGPTGSGKTTTLYASLSYLNQIDRKIITVEDPVEISLTGIVQGNFNPKMDLTYQDFIKSMMRQDPDIVMIGEIREKKTAAATIEAALTGHRVFTTLHADDTTGALLRLMDMGIDTYLISSTLISVLAQRLVRRVCPHCRETYDPDIETLKAFGVPGLEPGKFSFSRGQGCDLCNNTGFIGRVGIFESLLINDAIRDAIRAKKMSSELRQIARKSAKLISMAEDGLYKAVKEITTPEEVLRVVYRNEGDNFCTFSIKEIIDICENNQPKESAQ